MIKITGATKLLGVMGDPIEHSLSPIIQNAALMALAVAQQRAELEYVYLPWSVTAAALPKVVASLGEMGCHGFNVTIPHKQAIMPLLHHRTAIAQAVGAVNTVWQTDQGWAGTNTDVQGFIAPLQALERDWSRIVPCVLGSGGAARAVVAGCAELGCPRVNVVGRQLSKLQALQESFRTTLPLDLRIHPWEALSPLLPTTELLINTTPIGMSPQIYESPLSPLAIAQLPKTAIVYDLIYTPNPTQLLKDSLECDRIALNGLEMLVQQGAAALALWLNQPIPIDIMRDALLTHFAQLGGTALK